MYCLQVDADPDVLPRTDNFGLNYVTFVELCDETTVPDLLRLAFNCCIVSSIYIINVNIHIVRRLQDVKG